MGSASAKTALNRLLSASNDSKVWLFSILIIGKKKTVRGY